MFQIIGSVYIYTRRRLRIHLACMHTYLHGLSPYERLLIHLLANIIIILHDFRKIREIIATRETVGEGPMAKSEGPPGRSPEGQ